MTTKQKLEELLRRYLQHVLRANYIEIGDGHLCKEFLQILQKFIDEIAKKFDAEISALIKNSNPRLRREDLISWTVSEVSALQSITLSRLYFRICEADGLAAGQHRVDCGRAHGHAYLRSQLYEEAQLEWRSGRNVEPRSHKHIEKRRRRDWTPWLIDIVFK